MNVATATPASNHSTTEKQFSPLVRQFLDYLALERHFSDYPVKSYGADLIQFGQFLTGEIGQCSSAAPAEGAAPASIDDRQLRLDAGTIKEFLAYLHAQNYTKSTTARKLATLRSFYKFLIRRGLVTANPLASIRTPKQEKRLPKCLDLEQVQKLLDAPGDADILAARDKAMLEVLYSSGIRVSELVELQTRRPGPAGRHPARPRQGTQRPSHPDRVAGDQGAAAILRTPGDRRQEPGPHGSRSSSTSMANR